MNTSLPTDSNERKNVPLYSGVFQYAPAAWVLMAEISKQGNDKHNPGEPLHHARDKSMDHPDCILRHMMDISGILANPLIDRAQLRAELGQFIWRSSIWVQELAEKHLCMPLAPSAKMFEDTDSLNAMLQACEIGPRGCNGYRGS